MIHLFVEFMDFTPSFIHINSGKIHNAKVLDSLFSAKLKIGGFIYGMDKAYVNYA
jgi:hypothetical protein